MHSNFNLTVQLPDVGASSLKLPFNATVVERYCTIVGVVDVLVVEVEMDSIIALEEDVNPLDLEVRQIT